jgi:tripartite-type tricarboxylate transporter receptor subunit TctC
MAMIDVGMRENIKWDMVPFAGGQEVVTALLGKHIDVMSKARRNTCRRSIPETSDS